MASYIPALRNARMSAVVTQAGSGAELVAYGGGAVPANVSATATGTLLGTWTLPDPIGTVTGGVLTLGSISPATASGGSNTAPNYVRILNSGGTAIAQFTAGVSGGEFSFAEEVTAGDELDITGATITEGNA